MGAPVASDDGDHIAMIVVDGNGATVAYRKMWLSEAEALRFRPGDRPAVVAVDGWRLGLAICKDTGIAQRVRHRGTGHRCLRGGVLDSADDATIQDQRARRVAAEHHVWVVVASFAGSTGGGYEHAAARSRIWSPDGTVIASAGRETGGIARAMLTRTENREAPTRSREGPDPHRRASGTPQVARRQFLSGHRVDTSEAQHGHMPAEPRTLDTSRTDTSHGRHKGPSCLVE